MRDPGSVRQPSQQWCGHAASAASAWPELPGTRGDFEAALCLCGAKSVRAFFFFLLNAWVRASCRHLRASGRC